MIDIVIVSRLQLVTTVGFVSLMVLFPRPVCKEKIGRLESRDKIREETSDCVSC